jgi:antitoxin CptB
MSRLSDTQQQCCYTLKTSQKGVKAHLTLTFNLEKIENIRQKHKNGCIFAIFKDLNMSTTPLHILDQTEPTGTSLSLEARKRRCLYRAGHRGMREMDIIMGSFAKASLHEMSESDVLDFENLIKAVDKNIFAWVTGSEPIPSPFDTPVLHQMITFHQHPQTAHEG